MAKIPKNLSDKAMVEGFVEPESFERIFLSSQETVEEPVKLRKSGAVKESLEQSFVSPELAGEIGKALMELKLDLYKEGIVDYRIKVSRQARSIVLTPVVKKQNRG